MFITHCRKLLIDKQLVNPKLKNQKVDEGEYALETVKGGVWTNCPDPCIDGFLHEESIEMRSPFSAKMPELFFGLVGAVGTPLDGIIQALKSALATVHYDCHEISLIRCLKDSPWEDCLRPSNSFFDESNQKMDGGNECRRKLNRADALAILGVSEVLAHRRTLGSKDIEGKMTAPRQAYLFKSLKHPAELITLRKIYGENFFLIGAYAPRSFRTHYLAKKISQNLDPDSCRADVERLMIRDEKEVDDAFGQDFRDVFPRSDVFIDVRNEDDTESKMSRFIRLLFSDYFITPTLDEHGMVQATGAALCSADLGRQVGAAICHADGDLVSIGYNDVPRFPGGLYHEGIKPNYRDFVLQEDSSSIAKMRILEDILFKLQKSGLLKDDLKSLDRSGLRKVILGEASLSRSLLMSSLEYGRSVHAEMAALIAAARHGTPVDKCTLYTTTFPCHNCARHIVASGIKRVVFLDPYPKSRVVALHHDSIAVDETMASNMVLFERFLGVAPRRYIDLFTAGERKTSDGKIARWSPENAQVKILGSFSTYNQDELFYTSKFWEKEGKIFERRNNSE